MLGRAAFVALIVAGAAFAGCISGKDNGQKVDQQKDENKGLLPNQTVAPDGRGSISAFNETNKTETKGIGSMVHMHDYWGTETRKVIYQHDDGLIPLPLFPCKKPGCDFKNSADTYAAGTAIADFDIPAPPDCYLESAGVSIPCGLVYEGTDHLEVLFNNVRVEGTGKNLTPSSVQGVPVPVQGPANPGHPHINIDLDYLTSADEPFAFRSAGKVTPGTPVIIPVKPLEADMPHQTKSLWEFRVYTEEANAFSYNITITAVKGNPVVNWPPHPNLYADKPTRIIYDGDQKIRSTGPTYMVDGNDAGWQFPDRVLSWGTDSVDVEVTNFVYTSQAPVAPAKFLLEYHNASYVSKLGNGDQAGGRATDPASDGKTYHFTIKVDPQGYDTPYGQKSRWGFRFVPRFDDNTCPQDQTSQQFLTGCQWFPWDVSYHIKIIAHGHSIESGTNDPNDPNKANTTTKA